MQPIIITHIAQLKYIPTLTMYANLFNVASTLSDSKEFEHWQAKRTPDSVQLFDDNKKISLEVDSNTLTFTTEDSDQANELDKAVAKYSTLFLDPYDIKKFNRVGLRKAGIYSLNSSYGDFVEKFVDAFLKEKEAMKNLLADKLEDTLYVIESTKDGYSIRLRMAPLKPEQYKEFFPANVYSPEDPLKKETNFFIDLDIFRVYKDSELDYDTAMINTKAICEMIESIYNGVLELVEEKTE